MIVRITSADGSVATGCTLVLTVCASAAILWYFHDVFSYLPDDGAYAHVAQRLTAGEILNKNVQDIHAGYINFVNAGALLLFGNDLLSLRFPLVVLGIVQAIVLFFLLLPTGRVLAAASSVAVTALSFVQFINPTAHWYCYALIVCAIGVLNFVPKEVVLTRLVVLGFLIGNIALFRQLTGVIMSMATVAYLIYEGDDRHAESGFLGRGVILTMAAGLTGYLLSAVDIIGFLLIGIWPLGALLLIAAHTRVSAAYLVGRLAMVGAGAALAALPIAVYHTYHANWLEWFDDTVLAATELSRMPFINILGFPAMLVMSVARLFDPGTLSAGINAAFWFVLLIIPAINGAAVWQRLRLRREVPVLTFFATFFSVVSLHYQIPIYLYYSVGIALAGFVAVVAPTAGCAGRKSIGLALCAIAAVALYFHAGQPLSRGLVGVMTGVRSNDYVDCGLPRCNIRLEATTASLYANLVALVERHSTVDQPILAIPANPELYYLSGRRNPTRFFNSALGINDDSDYAEVLRTLKDDPPALVFFRPDDKYNTKYSRALAEHFDSVYSGLPPIGSFVIYQNDPVPDAAHIDPEEAQE